MREERKGIDDCKEAQWCSEKRLRVFVDFVAMQNDIF
jgi:hypothetical protein